MKKVLLFCSVSLVFLSGSTIAQKKCETPNNASGSCIPLRDCTSLFELLMKRSNLTSSEISFLRASQCGVQDNHPEVCCPDQLDKDSMINPPILPPQNECTFIQERIIGGLTASIGEYPWTALILYSGMKQDKPHNKFLCGGSLISRQHVLTAAHCVSGQITQKGWQPISVRLNENNLQTSPDSDEGYEDFFADPEVDIEISNITVHESYQPNSTTSHNDIALIHLSRPVTFNEFIRPVCLPIAPHLKDIIDRNDQYFMEIGFGHTEHNASSNVRRRLEQHGFNWTQCNNIYEQTVGPNEMCAGNEHKDMCIGDSGSGLTTFDRMNFKIPYWYIVGILSRRSLTCDTNAFPAVYTRVDKYIDWIIKNLKA